MRLSLIAITLSFFFVTHAIAGVNIKNGNFYISYTDHQTQGTSGFNIERTYNSKSSETGVFGFGWGSEFETRLFVTGDGAIVVKEHGAGSTNLFKPLIERQGAETVSVNQIIQFMLRDSTISNQPLAIAKKRAELLSSVERRNNAWIKYQKKGWLKVMQYPEGTEWTSTDFGGQKIVKTADGFKRSDNNGTDIFNNEGLLVAKLKENGKPVFTITTSDGKIKTLTDGFGNRFDFVMTEDGLVSSIRSAQGTSSYKYNENDYLISSTDVGGNIYLHTYDQVGNMTKIGYADGRFMRITYDPKTYYTISVTDKDGEITRYAYTQFFKPDGQADDSHYGTWVIKGPDGSEADSNYYEYEIKTKASGEEYTYRVITIINGISTETINNECCELPLSITRAGRKTTFLYSSNGKLLNRDDYRSSNTYVYDETSEHIIKATLVNKQTGDTVIKQFEYTSEGKVKRAQTGEAWAKFEYLQTGKIGRIESSTGTLNITYNDFDKPTKISLEGTGDLVVTYDGEGEISEVTSQGGTDVAAKISSAYQTLLKMADSNF